MKKIGTLLSVIIAPFMSLVSFICGCFIGKPVDIDNGEIMSDTDVKPKQKPAYEQYSKAAFKAYKEVADKHIVDGKVDAEHPEVIKAANEAAAKLYAYACYNENYLDKYVWFNNQTGETRIGGYAKICKQDYYLKVNETENNCGYRYYNTFKMVEESNGAISQFQGIFEMAKIRFITDTDVLYRFQGSGMKYGKHHEKLGCDLIECDWETGKDWGVKSVAIKKPAFVPPDKIEEDIAAIAKANLTANVTSDEVEVVIHGNINILAENIVKYAIILEETDSDCITVVMNIDTDVANNDVPSLQMLSKINEPTQDCHWQCGDNEPEDTYLSEDTGLKIVYRLWDNGLFRSYNITERWHGTIFKLTGTAESQISVNYSYSDRDCDLTDKLEMLDKAKQQYAYN